MPLKQKSGSVQLLCRLDLIDACKLLLELREEVLPRWHEV